MRKSLLLVGLLTFSSLVFAGTKSYSLAFASTTKVGGTQLAKGNYTVKVEGDKVTFTDDHFKAVSVPVKVDAGTGKKFEYTSFEATHKDDGTDVVKVIHFGGSTTTIEFGL